MKRIYKNVLINNNTKWKHDKSVYYIETLGTQHMDRYIKCREKKTTCYYVGGKSRAGYKKSLK